MCSLIDILQWKKIQKDSNDFWHRKLTLKVKFWYFLTAPHYSNFQNLVISFEYSWFLIKNLSNFVSLPWKLHNRKCHNNQVYNWPLICVWYFCWLHPFLTKNSPMHRSVFCQFPFRIYFSHSIVLNPLERCSLQIPRRVRGELPRD